MDPSGVNWLPSLVVVGVALLLGGVIAWRLATAARGRPAPAPGRPSLEVRDLEGKRDALFHQLRELEDTAAKRDPDQLERERYLLELAAARVLRELDERSEALAREVRRQSPPAAAAPPEAAPAAMPSTWRGFFWGVGTATAIAALFLLVDRAATPREAGGQLTGDIGPTSGATGPDAPPPAEAAEAQARAALQRDPENLEARLDLARALLVRDDLMAVWNETKFVLERAPGNPRALTYQSMVRLGMGQVDEAVAMLKKAQAADPGLIEPWVYMVAVYLQAGRAPEAEAAMAEAARRFPDRADGLTRLFAQMRGSRAGAAPGGAGAAPPHPQPAGDGRGISGVVEADPSLEGTIGPDSVVFVMVREAGFGAGPPVAAKRLVVSSLPVRFEITSADAMMGGELPARMLVEARLDADGDPVTRPPTDPRARVDDVPAGSSDVRLVVKRP
ncbi:MAG TPA: tetratricopeptide repeat protein [Vicinamibacteria bacterium]|nr:tetratricopeptide repeat protein [Vicinamibacteria bacterium]